MLIFLILIWLFLSLLAANLSANKGNSGLVAFLASLFLSPLIGLLLAVVQRPNQTALDNRGIKSGRLKRCPYCMETIKAKATICHYCNKDQ
jgi:phosphotransferase system  glucose/maltose/N-acetylglucosamine-specific IIC component